MTAFDFSGLQPDFIIDALQQYGLDISSGLSALNSYENRVYQFSAWQGDAVQAQKYVVKFYRPQRWTPAQIQEEHQFAFELAAAEIPVVAPLLFAGESLLGYQGFYFAVFPSRGGRTLEIDNDDQLAMLGRFLGRMHQVGRKHVFTERPELSVQSHLQRSQQVLAELELIPGYLRPAFDSALQQVIAEATRQYQPKKLIRLHGDCHAGNLFYTGESPFFVDLDDFKRINDQYGHDAGDRFLLAISARLQHDRREGDFISRIGGDEFVIFGLLTGTDISYAAQKLREQIFASTSGNFDIADTVLQYQGASVGLVVAAPGEKMSDILKRADTEMYLQKKQRSTRR